MRKLPRILSWIPAATWMVLIFAGSTDALSSRRTSRIIGPFLRWLYPGISDQAVEWVQTLARKTAHGLEYAILAVLIWWALNWARLGIPRPWPRRLALQAWGLATLYAMTDEFHQTFVSSRQGQIQDVVIDSIGALVAMFLLWWWGKRCGRWQSETVGDTDPGSESTR